MAVTFRAFHGQISELLLKSYVTSGCMRSADWCLKILVKDKRTMCFWGCDPKSWNSLPLNIKSVDTIDTFKNLSSTCSGLPLFSLYHLNCCVFFCIVKHFVTSALKGTLKKNLKKLNSIQSGSVLLKETPDWWMQVYLIVFYLNNN